MSLPPPTYSPSHSGTSSDQPRQYAEQPHAAAQRQSQRGVDPTRSRTTNRILRDYTLSKTLGAGSMGKVKLAHHNVTGEKVCPPFILSSYQRFCQCRSVFSFSTPSILIFDIHHCTAFGLSPLTTVTVVRPCVSPVSLGYLLSCIAWAARLSHPRILIRAMIRVTSARLAVFHLSVSYLTF
jgi:serine/threonine protein kinase